MSVQTSNVNETPVFDDDLASYNARILAFAQAFGSSATTIIYSTTTILAASLLGGDMTYATLPVTALVFGTMLGSLLAGQIMRRYGRRFGFLLSNFTGILFSLLASYAAYQGSFTLLCLSTFGNGVVAAFLQQGRFAATDTASPAFRPKAVSWVLTGGIVAAILGPQTVIFTKDLYTPFLFMATYMVQAGLQFCALIAVGFLRLPKRQKVTIDRDQKRHWSEIFSQRPLIIAVLCGATSYSLMNLLMTSAPLAMVGCGFSESEAALGIQWHVLAMYLPSFFSGSIISRFGSTRVIAAGFIVTGLSAIVGMSGDGLAHFWISLILLGLGWNFSYVGATTLLTTTYRNNEANSVQSINDFVIFSSMAVSSFSSGKLLSVYGWDMVNQISLLLVIVVLVLLLSLRVRAVTSS
ncbi:MFS transporter [Polycladidibacter stylochi]|uniref:MFS transporter n=1 Tax=Polycladidibacter stylochi TaxID=1807766 RepID=UPI00082CEDDC|nr:MFS transporter [Pseudovibrio stylochi]